MTDAGHPSRHGYVQCARCGTWRRRDRMRLDMFGVECEDTSWCIRQIRPVEASHSTIADAVESATDDAFIEWCRTPEARRAFDSWAEKVSK